MFDTFLMMKSEHALILVSITGLIACVARGSIGIFRLLANNLLIAHWFHVVNDYIVTTPRTILEKVQTIRCMVSRTPWRVRISLIWNTVRPAPNVKRDAAN